MRLTWEVSGGDRHLNFYEAQDNLLDCACGLYLNDPPPGTPRNPRRTSTQDH
jgi:hypothetical protein